MRLHRRIHALRERMAAADAAWYRMGTPASPADIVAMIWLDGEVDRDALAQRIRERLRAHVRFRQRVVDSTSGLPPVHWEEESDADADTHFEVRHLPEPGGEAELTAAANDIINEPFVSRTSPWRIYLLEGFRGGTVVLARLHHCMGDGFALVRVVLSLADEQDVLDASPSCTPSARGLTGHAFAWLRRVPHALGSLAHLLALSFDPPTDFRGRLCGRRHIAWSRPIELGRIRALARAKHVTMNDVLTTLAAGAFRAYHSSRAERVRPFRAIMPVNLRPPSEASGTEGNWFGLVYVELPLDEPDRNHRLGAVKAEIDRIKASEEALVSLVVMDLMGWMPPQLERVLQTVFARKGTVVVSNVIGPGGTFHVLGRRVRELFFWPPHPGALACGIGMLSYAGTIRVGVRSDLAVIFDPERVAELFEQELQAFEHEASAAPAYAQP